MDNCESIAKIMNDAGYDVEPFEMDLSSRESIKAMIAKAQEYGEIKYMINGAGVSPSQASIETILKVDLYGTAVLLEEVGKVIAEGSWRPFDTLNETHMLYSHSKSFTSTAAGFLVDDGKLDLDERVVDIFPEHVTEKTSENMRQIRVRDLLTMNAGQDREAEYNDVSGDWVRAFIANDTPRVPGKGFRYDSCATHVVAAIVERKTGKKLMDFLEERLFSKIGITGAWSNTSPTGVACGGWGMNMKTRDLARFGLLYLNEGRWQGEQVISRDWVRLATSLQTRTDRPGDGDWSQGYGFQFWRCRHNCFRADGAFGQYTIVMPDQDALISMTAGLSDMGKEQELVWRHLLPAMKDAPLSEDKAASDALAARCRSLAFPTVKGEVKGSASGVGRSFALEGEQKRFFFRKASLVLQGVPIDIRQRIEA
jgi:CubicO group peptidase (beta-lactamase class C family)